MRNPCVLIPSYNEEKTIGPIIDNLKGRGLAVYVVDDGSIDNTYSEACRAGAQVMRSQKNLGKGAALRIGFEAVLRDGCEAVLVMDGDGQHDVGDIDLFLKKMDETGADMVIGNRMAQVASMPYIRVLVNTFMSDILSRITGQHIPDSQCGFRLISKEVLEKIKLESSNYEIESEMIVKAARAGFRIESVGIKTVYRGQMSKINPVIDTLRFMALIFKIWRGKTFMLILVILLSAMVSGCAALNEGMNVAIGISTRDIEAARKDAVSETFDYDYDVSFDKVARSLKYMNHVSIYASDPKKRLIAFYYTEVNVTPVGVFFTEIDRTHTCIEIASPSQGTKELMAKAVFSRLKEKKKEGI